MEINEVIGNINNKKELNNEIFFNLLELKKVLKLYEVASSRDYILVPYYICKDKVYELYQYEFLLDKTKKSFESYLLEFTSKYKIQDVPSEISNLRKNCFANKKKDEFKKLLNWIDYLIYDKSIENELNSIFGKYDISKLYVQLYM